MNRSTRSCAVCGHDEPRFVFRQEFSALSAGKLLAPAKTAETMGRVIFNDYVDATLAALFVAVVLATVIYAVIDVRKALSAAKSTAIEISGAAMAGAGR